MIFTRKLFKGRALELTYSLVNPGILTLAILKSLYLNILCNDLFIGFGTRKVILITVQFTDKSHKVLHPNVLITNFTPFYVYYLLVKEYIRPFFNPYYGEDIAFFKVLVWNMDDFANKNIKITVNGIETVNKEEAIEEPSKSTEKKEDKPTNETKASETKDSQSGIETSQVTDSALNIVLKDLGKTNKKVKKYLKSKVLSKGSGIKGKHNGSQIGKQNGINSLIPRYDIGRELRKAPTFKFYATKSVKDSKLVKDYNFKREALKSLSNIQTLSKDKEMKDFGVLDLETVNVGDGIQEVIAISFKDKDNHKLFLVDPDLFEIDREAAVKNLWLEFFTFIKGFKGIIFTHNLGSFDGYFIYRILFKFFGKNEVTSLISDASDFILIKIKSKEYNLNITFKDSIRIFPVSLKELCKVYNVEGKFGSYNAEVFNNINIFRDLENFELFKTYALQDTKSLYDALKEAQRIFFDSYTVDISTIVSASSLALKIYRTNFLKIKIPKLLGSQDKFIRDSYRGGATDYYKCYAENIHYYDVNSLYPYAMCKPMPVNLKTFHKDMSNMQLEDFFGFVKVEVECPETILIPTLPTKHKDKTIYPHGKWIDTYFSEELKAHAKLGYKFKLLEGYSFTSELIFKDYVENFYEIKKNATGPKRYIAKFMLNNLYGIFGRKTEELQTINIHVDDLPKYLLTTIIKSIISIDEDNMILLIVKNLNNDIINKLNSTVTFENFELPGGIDKPSNSNVAIASAVTSYARMHMITFKTNYNVIYTDTDSIFTTDKLPDELIGSELGLMKDELDGGIIEAGYFLGIKQYGFKYTDNGQIKEKSVFAGVKRNSLTFE